MLKINHLHPQGEPGITVLALQGQLDGLTFKDLVAKSMELYQSGLHCVLLDLTNLNYMSISGLSALHSVARLMRGDSPNDIEMGWSVFHEIRYASQSGLQPGLKIYNPQPYIVKMLESSGLDHIVEIFYDYNSALSSFICHNSEMEVR